MLAIGQVIGACVAQGTKDISNSASYRIPVGINLAIVLAIVVGLFFIPESPRWLIFKNREDAAIRALERVNKDQKDSEEVVKVELESYLKSKKEEEEMNEGGGTGWGALLQGTQRRRFLCAFGILISQQISGVQVRGISLQSLLPHPADWSYSPLRSSSSVTRRRS